MSYLSEGKDGEKDEVNLALNGEDINGVIAPRGSVTVSIATADNCPQNAITCVFLGERVNRSRLNRRAELYWVRFLPRFSLLSKTRLSVRQPKDEKLCARCTNVRGH